MDDCLTAPALDDDFAFGASGHNRLSVTDKICDFAVVLIWPIPIDIVRRIVVVAVKAR